MAQIGDIRRPSKYCVKWEHDRSECYDEYKEATIGGKKYDVWFGRCSELVRIGNKVCGKMGKITKSMARR